MLRARDQVAIQIDSIGIVGYTERPVQGPGAQIEPGQIERCREIDEREPTVPGRVYNLPPRVPAKRRVSPRYIRRSKFRAPSFDWTLMARRAGM